MHIQLLILAETWQYLLEFYFYKGYLESLCNRLSLNMGGNKRFPDKVKEDHNIQHFLFMCLFNTYDLGFGGMSES